MTLIATRRRKRPERFAKAVEKARAATAPPWLLALLALVASNCQQEGGIREQINKASPMVSEITQKSPQSTPGQITPERPEDLPSPSELSPEERERLMKGTEIEVTPLAEPRATPKSRF
jgi:hypothetical protein